MNLALMAFLSRVLILMIFARVSKNNEIDDLKLSIYVLKLKLQGKLDTTDKIQFIKISLLYDKQGNRIKPVRHSKRDKHGRFIKNK
jgi:hypothetical protein